jgi:hypothetical protein
VKEKPVSAPAPLFVFYPRLSESATPDSGTPNGSEQKLFED